MPQDDPILAAVKKARGRAQAPADPLISQVRAARAASAPPAIVPNDTTVGPEGIRANDEEGVQRYLRETDSLARNAVPLGTPVRDMTPRPRVSVPAAGRGAPGFNPQQAAEYTAQIPLAVSDIVHGILSPASPTFAPLSSAEARHPTTQAAATRYGPTAVSRVRAAAKRLPGTLPGDVDTPLERAKSVATGLPLMGYQMERAAIEAEGPEKLRRILGLASLAGLGAGGGERPAVLRERVQPGARPPVPYELEPMEAGFPTKPAPPTRPKGVKATRAELDKVITQQRSTLTPSPAELDALIQKQQADLEAGIAGPAERPGKVPAQNPLTELDDAIAKDRSDIEALEAELAARRARETEPDKLRELPDEALGETPPLEQSAAAALESRIPEIAERILQEERRKEQRPFEGAEQRAPDRLQALLDEASRRMTALEQRHALERKGFMGTGAKSMAPEDVAQTRIIGEKSEDRPQPTVEDRIGQQAATTPKPDPFTMSDEDLLSTVSDRYWREEGGPPAPEGQFYNVAGELVPEAEAQAAAQAERVRRIQRDVVPDIVARINRANSWDAAFRAKNAFWHRVYQELRGTGKLTDAQSQELTGYQSPVEKALSRAYERTRGAQGEIDPRISRLSEAMTHQPVEFAGRETAKPPRKRRLKLSNKMKEMSLEEAERGPEPPEVVGEIKPPPAAEHIEGVPGSQALHDYFESPEVQERISGYREPWPWEKRGKSEPESHLGPERMPGESVLDYSRRIREQVEPEDVRTPGTTGGNMPPLPPEKPAAPIDMSGLDVQIEALRAEQARLREAAERAKVENPAEHPSFARKARLREKGGAGQEAQKAREKLPSRRELQREVRSLQATLRMVEKSLQRYPESDTRPHAIEYRNELLQTKLAAMERLNEVMELKKGTPYKRPPLKGPKGTMGPGLGGPESGAMRMFPEGRGLFRRRKPLSDKEVERLQLLSSEVEEVIRRGGRYDDVSPELGERLRHVEKKFDTGWPLNYEDLRAIQEYRDAMHMPPLTAWEKARYMMRREPRLPGPDIASEEGFALNPFAKKPTAPRTVAQRLVDKQIGVGELAERTPLRVRWHQLIQNLTETSHYVGKLERIAAKHGRKLPISQRARLFMKAALDSPKRISGALYEGGPGYFDPATGAWTPLDSPSLEAVIKPIAGDVEALQDVRRLLVAEHNPAMLAAGRETGISPAAATDIVQRAKPRTLSIATGMRNWLNATVEGAVRVGALPRSLLDIWQKKYPYYIPAERVFEGEGAVRGGSGSTRSSVRPPARRAKKGGEQPYADPFETIPDYGARWIRYTDLYQATRSTLDLVTQNRDLWGDLAVKVNEKPLAQVNAVEHISELLSDRALRLEGDQVKMYNPKTNTIETWKLEPILADGLRALSGREWDFVTEFLGAAKRGVQFGVTNNPFFGLANWLRDNAGRPVMSGATNYPLANTIGESPLYKTMGGGFGVAEESGGFFEGLRRSVPGRSKLRSAQRARQGRAAKLTGTTPTAIRTMRALPEALKLMSVPFEEATRGAEFRAQKAKGLSDLEAYVNAQEVLGNFAEHGTAAWVRWLSHVTPFLNPRVQGLRAFYDAGTRRPGGTALKAALTITIPSVALYALQQDDQEIEDLRNGPGGYNSWFIRPSNILPNAPNDVILRVPKPFLPGALGSTSVEHALDALRDRDPHAFKRMLSDVGNELWQSSINPALGVPQALATNKAIGTGVPIVPEEQKGFLPEEQTGTHPNYSLQEVSRSLPEPLRFSPARAQYALGQFGGTAGRELPNLMDILRHAERLPERRGLADVPGVSRFFARTPTSAAAPIRDVYDDARRGNQIMETLKGLTANGDVSSVLRLLDEHGDDLARAGEGQTYTQKLSQLSDAAQFFANSEHLTPHERRIYRDEMLRLETELARMFHGLMHEK